MPRLALFALLLILAGCGAAAAAAPSRPDRAQDTAAIQARVAAYVGHMLAGDGARACAQFAPRYRREMDKRAGAAGIGSCADAISLYGEALEGSVPDGFAEQATDPARIVVILHGDRAEAAMKSPRGGLSVKRTTLIRVDGAWLIDGLGVHAARYDG